MQFSVGCYPEPRSKGEVVQSLADSLPFFLLSHSDYLDFPLQASAQQKEVSQEPGEAEVGCVGLVGREGQSTLSLVFLADEADHQPRHLDT